MHELLNRASDQRLALMVNRHALPGQALTRKQMLAALQAKLTDSAYLRTCLANLPEPAQRLLRYLMLHPRFYSFQSAPAGLFGPRPQSVLDDLQGRGLIAEPMGVPIEVRQAAAGLWAEGLLWEGPPFRYSGGPDPTGPAVVRDLIAMLAMGARRTLPLTQKGGLFKKAEEELLTRVEDAAQVKKGTIPLIVLDYAVRRGLLMPADYAEGADKPKPGLVPTASADDWIQASREAIWTDISHVLMTEQTFAFPGAPAILAVLAAAPDGRWLRQQAWGAELDAMSSAHAWQPANSRSLGQFLGLLTGLDLLEVVVHSTDGPLLRPTPALKALCAGHLPPLPLAETQFYVQPNFEVIAPKTLPPAIQYRLEYLTENRRADKVLQYTLSFAGVRPELEANEPIEPFIDFLQQHSKAPLPPNVVADLRAWAARGARARFESVTLLRLTDSDTAARIMADRQIKGAVIAALTPTDLVVDAAAVQKIRKRLGELNVVAVPGIAKPGRTKSGAVAAFDGEYLPTLKSPTDFAEAWLGISMA